MSKTDNLVERGKTVSKASQEPAQSSAATTYGRAGQTTAMADAFARAMAARKLDIDEVPRVKDGEARELFTGVRWAEFDGRPHCIHCGAEKPYALSSRPGIYRCRYGKCAKQFSITSKTAFASHKLPLQGCLVALGSVVDDAGLRTIRLAEAVGLTYKAAWSMGRKLGLWTRDERMLAPRPVMNYPYQEKIVTGRDDFDLVMAINKAVPIGLPEEMRADVCQETALSILCGDFTRENLKAAVAAQIKAYNRLYDKWKVLSLDNYIGGESEGARFIDMVDAEREHW